mmetsp:Transcript_28201/g.51984  ORF Transcript_28201/g.51984 Transcript_28201/m.51984 type:complete len:92 (+) Transcript_28201:140-415(+)
MEQLVEKGSGEEKRRKWGREKKASYPRIVTDILCPILKKGKEAKDVSKTVMMSPDVEGYRSIHRDVAKKLVVRRVLQEGNVRVRSFISDSL